MRTAIYVRVAVAAPTGQSLIERKPPIEQQLDRLREHLIAGGVMPAEEDIFRDEGLSGLTLDRPTLNDLRSRVSLGTYERIMVISPDRLSRSHSQFNALVEEFGSRGCRLESLE